MTHTIVLTDAEFQTLLLVIAASTSSALSLNDDALAKSFLRLVNAVNRGNPLWIPYELCGTSAEPEPGT